MGQGLGGMHGGGGMDGSGGSAWWGDMCGRRDGHCSGMHSCLKYSTSN